MGMPKTVAARAGYTLLEVTVVLVLFSSLSAAAIMAVGGGSGNFGTTSRTASLEGRARRTLDRVSSELLGLGEEELDPNPEGLFGTSDLTYARVADFVDDAIVWGPKSRLLLEYEAGEVDDDMDNDGDGLIDEGVLVLVRDDGGLAEQRVVICRGVSERLEGEVLNAADDNGNFINDEAGFNVHRVGDILSIRLTLEDADDQGERFFRTMTTSVRLRN